MSETAKGGAGVVDAALRQVDGMFAEHRAEMRGLIDRIGELTLRDHFAQLAIQVLPAEALRVWSSDQIANAMYELADACMWRRGLAAVTSPAPRGPSHVLRGTVSSDGNGWVPNSLDLMPLGRFITDHAGADLVITFEVVRPAPHDTERPPPPDEPVAADLDEIENVEIDESNARALGKMVGAERGEVTKTCPIPEDFLAEAFAKMTPEERARFVNAAAEPPLIYGTIVDGPKVKA